MPLPLTPQQAAAADHRGSPALLLAGPGTGKSRTITERVRRLLVGGNDPSRVLVLTFTRNAAQDLRDALAEGELDPTGATTRTLHSYSFQQVRFLTGEALLGPHVLDDWEEKEILRAHLARRIALTPGRISERFREYDAAWETLTPPPSFPEQAVFEQELRRLRGVLRFARRGELVNVFKELLDADPNLDAGLDQLIVDEFQDLNQCDQAVIQRLAGAGAELFVAGDDDQSIYAFRHADASGIRDFEATYPGSESFALTECYRCCPEILAPSQALIAYAPVRLPKELRSMVPASGRLEALSFDSPTGGCPVARRT